MKLIDHMPGFYKNSPEVVSIQTAYQNQIEKLQAARDDFLLQLDVNTATWGLALYERDLGIVSKATDSYEFRRTRIISKMRGAGTATQGLIKNVAESFLNGKVAVTECPGEYRFTITFIDTRGIPPNINDMTDAIEEIKPAHLAVSFAYTYTVWAEVKATTWGALKTGTWDELRTRMIL